MSGWRQVTCSCALMLAAYAQLATAQSGGAAPSPGAGSAAAAQGKSVPPAGDFIQARYAWGTDPAKRCPELRQTQEGAVALLQFMVGPTGVPSKVSVRESSGSESFDAAATSCVLKLRFQAATRLGDAAAVESWQQLALKSAGPAGAPHTSHCEPGTGQASETGSTAGADAQAVSDRKRQQPGPTPARAGVCVCVDDTGKLTQAPVLTSSSGMAAFDKAALELSTAASYRPSTSSSGQPTPG